MNARGFIYIYLFIYLIKDAPGISQQPHLIKASESKVVVLFWRKPMMLGTFLWLPTTTCLQFTYTSPKLMNIVCLFSLNLAMKGFVEITKSVSTRHII